MTWLLTIIYILNGQPVEYPTGLMRDAVSCQLAGLSMTRAMAMGTPGLVVGWRCDAPGVLS